MLFPMERLFEDSVAVNLKRSVSGGWRVESQSRPGFLVDNWGGTEEIPIPKFQLRPDMCLRRGSECVVLGHKVEVDRVL